MLNETEYKMAKQLAHNFMAKAYDKESAAEYMLKHGHDRRFIIEVMVNMN